MENSPQIEVLALNKRQVCAALGGISETTLWRLEKRGLLAPVPGVRNKLYSVEAVRDFVRGGSKRGAA